MGDPPSDFSYVSQRAGNPEADHYNRNAGHQRKGVCADLELTSELTIRSASGESCYIKLKDSAGNDVFSFFVRAGDSITVAVPSGYFYVFFAYGDEWYGPESLFGPDTTYGKDDELCDFENYTWEYTLYPTYDGNFSETPISADEF